MVSNKVILIGNLTKDAVIVPPKTQEQKPIVHFIQAVNRFGKKSAEDQRAVAPIWKMHQKMLLVIRKQNVYMKVIIRIIDMELSVELVHGLAHACNAETVDFFLGGFGGQKNLVFFLNLLHVVVGAVQLQVRACLRNL